MVLVRMPHRLLVITLSHAAPDIRAVIANKHTTGVGSSKQPPGAVITIQNIPAVHRSAQPPLRRNQCTQLHIAVPCSQSYGYTEPQAALRNGEDAVKALGNYKTTGAVPPHRR